MMIYIRIRFGSCFVIEPKIKNCVCDVTGYGHVSCLLLSSVDLDLDREHASVVFDHQNTYLF